LNSNAIERIGACYPKVERLNFTFGVEPADILSQFRAGRFSLRRICYLRRRSARREPEFCVRLSRGPKPPHYYAAFNCHTWTIERQSLRNGWPSIDVATVVRQTLTTCNPSARADSNLVYLVMNSRTSRECARIHVRARQPNKQIELRVTVNPVFFGEYAALAREISALSAITDHNPHCEQDHGRMLEGVSQASVDVV